MKLNKIGTGVFGFGGNNLETEREGQTDKEAQKDRRAADPDISSFLQ